MKVLISWSGSRSKAVAQALRHWIPFVIPRVDPWMSAEDIRAGTRWNQKIAEELANTHFGILCLTQENHNAPWVLFEAGALAKTLENTFVCPYLLDLTPTDLGTSPLGQFQAKQANKEQTWELVLAINRALGNESSPEDRLRVIFDRWWPDLEQELRNLPEATVTQNVKYPFEEMLNETLEEVRWIKHNLEAEKLNKTSASMRDHELQAALKHSEARVKTLQNELNNAHQQITALEAAQTRSEKASTNVAQSVSGPGEKTGLPIKVPEHEERLHKDAIRFARLLVSEIKLYNDEKLRKARAAKNIYEHLKVDIDRNRAMYDKRVAPEVASSHDYFNDELIRVLAEGNPKLMGNSYPNAQ